MFVESECGWLKFQASGLEFKVVDFMFQALNVIWRVCLSPVGRNHTSANSILCRSLPSGKLKLLAEAFGRVEKPIKGENSNGH